MKMHIRFARAVAAVAVANVPAAAADAKTVTCKSAHLRDSFQPDEPRTFGVFHLRITGWSCPTAHRVAKAWMTEFEAGLRARMVRLPRRIEGFALISLPPTAPQTYRLRAVKAPRRINCDYVVPNG